jgi:hypothetical protein
MALKNSSYLNSYLKDVLRCLSGCKTDWPLGVPEMLLPHVLFSSEITYQRFTLTEVLLLLPLLKWSFI